MMIIQAYMLSDARISVNRQGGGCRAYPWDLVKLLSAMVVHFGHLRITNAVTFDNTRTPSSFISHGRWLRSKLLKDNMVDIEKREQEEDEVMMEVTQVTQVSEFCEIFCSANIPLWNEIEIDIDILLNCVVIIWSPPFLQ